MVWESIVHLGDQPGLRATGLDYSLGPREQDTFLELVKETNEQRIRPTFEAVFAQFECRK